MHVLLTGGTGFIGSALTKELLALGNSVTILSRESRHNYGHCQFVQSLDEISSTAQLDAVINLAGASMAAQRWTPSYKKVIIDSRMDTARSLNALIARITNPPQTLLSASAIGYYGHHGDERLTEESAVTPGFAQKLCYDLETLALRSQRLGVRVCPMRLGVVLDNGGGALTEMAQSFGFGIASWLGTGKQWLSWVHRRDVVRSIIFLLEHNQLQGPVNITSPEPVIGRDFCQALKAHHRTYITAGVPAPVLRILLGEMAEELLLNGQRVIPQRLLGSGFVFDHPDIKSALTDIYSIPAI
ncbi:MAG: hypothetical protein ACI9JM_003293 [Halioglobus sp.]|jgi:uncharacterized protein (TIGR01777 family)